MPKETPGAGTGPTFEHAMMVMTTQAVRDVKEEVNINLFWQSLMNAWNVGVFGKGLEAQKCFRAMGVVTGAPPDAPGQRPEMTEGKYHLRPWVSYKLYMDFNTVLARMGEYLAKQRERLPLSQRDLRDQLSKNEYWVPGEWKQRMPPSSKAPTRCWCIDVDKHPLGYQKVSDADLELSRQGSPLSEWVDPRMGDLYKIILEVEKTQTEME